MGWSEELGGFPPVRSMLSAVRCLDGVFNAESWSFELRYMSPAYCVAKIECRFPVDPEADHLTWEKVIREGASLEGVGGLTSADVAFLRAYEMLGGKVDLPKAPAPVAPPPSKPMPGTRSAPPISASMPAVAYTGPKPWDVQKDAYPDVHPAHTPAPPAEPEWFKAEIGGLLKKKHPGVTWSQAVETEIQSPDGRDQPLSMIRWALTRPSTDPKFVKHSKAWSAKAKATLIWHMQKEQQLPNYDEDAGGYAASDVDAHGTKVDGPWGNEPSPF